MENKIKKRVKPEVYSRVVGYLRPVSNWNEGKQAEFRDRITFLKQNPKGDTEAWEGVSPTDKLTENKKRNI